MKIDEKPAVGHNTNAGLRRLNARLRVNNEELLRQIEDFRRPPVLISEGIGPTKIGHIAEYYFRYQLSRRGISFHVPETQSPSLDLLVEGASRFYRCEVKGFHKGPARLTCRKGFYGPSDHLDFFVLVHLVTEDLFIVPFDVLVDRSEISLDISSQARDSVISFRDRFELFA